MQQYLGAIAILLVYHINDVISSRHVSSIRLACIVRGLDKIHVACSMVVVEVELNLHKFKFEFTPN